MATWELIRAFLALLVVLGMIFGVAWAMRRYGPGMGAVRPGMRRRLGTVEMLGLDSRRRLVLVRRDDQEHLLLIGGTRDVVIEAGITPPLTPTPAPEATTPHGGAALPRPEGLQA